MTNNKYNVLFKSTYEKAGNSLKSDIYIVSKERIKRGQNILSLLKDKALKC